MNKKNMLLPVMAVLLVFLSAVFWGKAAEAAEKELIDSGDCGEMHYYYENEDDDYFKYEADGSVKYELYKDGTMVISGNGIVGDFDSWKEGSHTWYRRKELIPWYDYRKDIKKVVVEDGVTTIGKAAFYGCKNLESVQLSDTVSYINDNAFRGSGIKAVEFPDSLERIGGGAFYGCNGLTEIELPSHIKICGAYIFAECRGLKKASFDRDFKFRPWYFNGTQMIGGSDGGGMFSGCTALEEIVLPEEMPAIPDYFVRGCTKLKSFPIPKGVVYWGSYPPALCTGRFVMPDSVTALGEGGFAECVGMKKLVLPEGLVYMGKAFEGCSSLKTVKIPGSVKELDQTFYNCTGLTSIVIPKTVKEGLEYNYPIYSDYSEGVFEGCSNLKSVVLPQNMECIGNSLFAGCTNLERIVLPSKLSVIGDSAFYGCSSLTGMEIPDTVYEIEAYAFSSCTSLKKIKLPSMLSYISHNAFSGCTSLEEIDIPKGVDTFYNEVFYNCKNLRRVTIRADEFSFYGKKIFNDCKNLSEINIYAKKATNISIPYSTFDEVRKGVTVYVPRESINRYKKWLKGTPGIKDVKPIH